MDTQNPSLPAHAQSVVTGNEPPVRANPRPHVRSAAGHPSGVVHDNSRHTDRFTVIGNHLAQHHELSLLAIGLGVHIQSLPAGARVDIKTLVHRFPEGSARIAAALRELETHGYLHRRRERTPAGRIVTRTVSCNQPTASSRNRPTVSRSRPAVLRNRPAVLRNRPAAAGHGATLPDRAQRPEAPTEPAPDVTVTRGAASPVQRTKRSLPAVPAPAFPAQALLRRATDLLADLRVRDPRLLLSTIETDHLAPGVAAWLEREVSPLAVSLALSADLPPGGPRHPAALLAHRLIHQLPPPPPFRAPAAPAAPAPHPFQTCDVCDRAFRAPGPGRCAECGPAPAPAAPPIDDEPRRDPDMAGARHP
ncbi:helix-turn-helix domain-containing protein [Streptomyces sp. NBC_01497]|uniref:helix-turn-helix domain-containing protein n=1 Tax=Streptomyces sp. NBC_01497 TaxID=2903885 RepID=UPI002E34239E|nr:helix-turn-helix domain-containing protein [Streptomyces sp. NBC_01497]